MNTVQLECFLAVAQYLNFSKAAESVSITQPAVSHQIGSLEDELGVKLFVRTSKSVSLTREGIMFISDAEQILKIAGSAKFRLSEKPEDEPVRTKYRLSQSGGAERFDSCPKRNVRAL